MKEFKTISLATQVFEKLEEDIITGVYPRGEMLTELKLVEQLGVSRTPIREALRRLEQERLIAESGKGSVVLGITMEDLVDIMDIRQRIEGLAAYYAARNLTEEGKQVFVMGHPEYDRLTLQNEYLRDKNKGLPIDIPKNYFPNDDDTQKPKLQWRSHCNNLYTNWLNYFVYQTTPYEL